ncbi:tyrosine protein phosphatase yvh1 [Naganishia albida]|nr:tyrosine protein phosphatase yvh1 [Naganishia albida]
MSSPISPPRNALALNANGNEGTTVRSAGLSSTDDEAFELYLQAQKQLQSHRAAQSRAQLRGQGETGETVADMEAREFEAISEASDGDSVEEQDEEGELGHMQEIVEGLWIGDVVAARDGTALQEAGITAILTLLRQKLPPPPPGILTLPIPIDDTPDADILCHLDGCVRWIADVLEAEQASERPSQSDSGERPGRKGAVLVHCQAGMSRSATVVAAYLMKTLNIPPEEAVEMIREKRPVVYPSETFREQLALWYKAKFKATVRDRDIRQWYMERTAVQVRNNGELEEEATQHMAKYPATPTASMPATPVGGYGKRKIRCKMCRRNLATREHMMDHILDQSPMPVARSRAPSVISLGEAETSAAPRSRPPSISTSRPTFSMSQIETPDAAEKAVPSPRREESPAGSGEGVKKAVTDPGIMKGDALKLTTGRRVLDPRALAASLPPQLAALRAGVRPLPAPATVPSPQDDLVRRSSSPSAISTNSEPSPRDSMDESALSTSPEKPGLGRSAARRMSVLAMTPTGALPRRDSSASYTSRRGSSASAAGVSAANWPILVNPKCSGYFVEPLTWMEPMLASGVLAGKIVCPNEKCGAKIGSFDWAGVQCGCKEWVTPGFCIHRSKVDEIW